MAAHATPGCNRLVMVCHLLPELGEQDGKVHTDLESQVILLLVSEKRRYHLSATVVVTLLLIRRVKSYFGLFGLDFCHFVILKLEMLTYTIHL